MLTEDIAPHLLRPRAAERSRWHWVEIVLGSLGGYVPWICVAAGLLCLCAAGCVAEDTRLPGAGNGLVGGDRDWRVVALLCLGVPETHAGGAAGRVALGHGAAVVRAMRIAATQGRLDRRLLPDVED